MGKLNRIIKIVIVIFTAGVLSIFSNQTLATNQNTEVIKQDVITEKQSIEGTRIADASLSNIINAGNDWINSGKTDVNGNPIRSAESFAGEFVGIGQVLVAVGIVTLLITSAIMAIRWIVATPDKQAKLKEQLIGLVIAAIVIFGAVGIWNLVRGIGSKVEENLQSGSISIQTIEAQYNSNKIA